MNCIYILPETGLSVNANSTLNHLLLAKRRERRNFVIGPAVLGKLHTYPLMSGNGGKDSLASCNWSRRSW